MSTLIPTVVCAKELGEPQSPEIRALASGWGIVSLPDMMSFYGDLIVELSALLGDIESAHSAAVTAAIALGDEAGVSRICASEDLRSLIRAISTHREHLKAAGLSMTMFSFERLVRSADDPGLTVRDAAELSRHLTTELKDELSLCSFWQVPREYQCFLEPQLFGPEADVIARDDIEEAGNCLAFGRGTACVFHLMRVVEKALRSLAATLNDPSIDPRRNPSWDAILKKFDSELKRPKAQRSPEWRTDDTFFSEVTAHLHAIKNGWRNPSLHVERTYTPDMAHEIFIAVRAFMRHLAGKLRAAAD